MYIDVSQVVECCVLLHEIHQYTLQGLGPIGLKTFILNVFMHKTTYNIHSSTSKTFIQEYFSITLSVVSKFLYLQLPLFIFNIVYVNWMY